MWRLRVLTQLPMDITFFKKTILGKTRLFRMFMVFALFSEPFLPNKQTNKKTSPWVSLGRFEILKTLITRTQHSWNSADLLSWSRKTAVRKLALLLVARGIEAGERRKSCGDKLDKMVCATLEDLVLGVPPRPPGMATVGTFRFLGTQVPSWHCSFTEPVPFTRMGVVLFPSLPPATSPSLLPLSLPLPFSPSLPSPCLPPSLFLSPSLPPCSLPSSSLLLSTPSVPHFLHRVLVVQINFTLIPIL